MQSRTLSVPASFSVRVSSPTWPAETVVLGIILVVAAFMRLVRLSGTSGDLDEGIRGIQLLLMLAEDLIFYWVHRAQHRYELLWAMHSFHHSDDELNVATSHRHYWLEKPMFLFVFYMPLGLVFRISPATASTSAGDRRDAALPAR